MDTKDTKTRKIPFLLLALFLVSLAVGINAGEVTAVWDKAVKICLSCMGIG
jgi:hypothetical protein